MLVERLQVAVSEGPMRKFQGHMFRRRKGVRRDDVGRHYHGSYAASDILGAA